MKHQNRKNDGFTLIELIIVIAIIGLLAAAAFVAVDPAKRIGDANNAQRWADVTAIADAWVTYIVDNSGSLPTTTDETGAGSGPTSGVTYAITTSTSYVAAHSSSFCSNTTTAGFITLSSLVTNGYIGQLPLEPTYAAATEGKHTQYYFYRDTTGIIRVGACESYNSEDIEVVR